MLQSIVRASLRNRALVLAGTGLLIALGAMAIVRLPIDAVPDVTNVQVQIITPAPALSPLEVEQYVTFPVERGLGGIAGLKEQRSVSRYGLSVVTAVFDDRTDIYFARQQIGERLREIAESIPARYGRPGLGPISTALGEVYQFVVRGKGHTLMELETLLDWTLMPQMRMVPGVVELNSFGGEDKQYEVLLDPRKLAAAGLGLSDVLDALSRSNANAGGGYIERNREATLIRAQGLISNLDDVRNVVVAATPRGAPITVGALGTVGFAPRMRRGAATMNGEGEVVVGVALMLLGENSRVVTQKVKARLEEIKKTLPEGVSIEPYYDRSELVDRTIRTATKNLAEGALLVIGVLFLLLGSLRAGLVVATAIPLAMLAAVIGMYVTRTSGNLMSLGAIDFGLIVDGAVIIIENASRRLTEKAAGMKRALGREERDAVIASATFEVQHAAVFGVFIIGIVYVPVLLLTGIEGKLFRPMAATVLFALAGAFLLSLTLMPVLASLFIRGEAEREPRLLAWARRLFEPALGRAQRHPVIVMVAGATILLAAVVGFRFLGAEFVPTLDEGSLLIEARRLPGTALSTSVETDLRLERALRERVPEITDVVSRIGAPEVANDPMGVEQSDVYILLKPQEEWRRGKLKADIGRDVADVLDTSVPEIAYRISQPIQMRTNELIAGIRSDVAVSIYGDDLGELRRLGDRAGEILRRVPGAAGVKIEQVAGQPYLTILPDRVRLARYGLAIEDVNAATETLAVGYDAGPIFEGQKRFSLVVRQRMAGSDDVEAIRSIPLKARDGRIVPLGDVAEVKRETGPAQISRDKGSRRLTVETNVSGRDTVGFVAEAQAALARGLKLPAGYHLEWGGQFEHYTEARNRLLLVVPLALALILLLLYMAFKELSPAVIIFLNVPFAITGGVAALLLRGLPFSISAGVGFIALFGVAVLNGLVLLSVAHRHEENGIHVGQAAFRAAHERLRPVLMTALVAILGFVPMALSTAPGSEVQRPLATVVIGGLVSSTLLTLLVLPTVYSLVRGRLVARKGA
ncbi:MAG TPA: CusA/CzcA family heavy metal efflux RND transporter [Myxococcales bacterium]|nr:CusA/CzcA family heavy metal efflux RND transporter [Myxococcales bacterium]